MASNTSKWVWFCGDNFDPDIDDGDDQGGGGLPNSSCDVNLALALPQVVFIILFPVVLLVLHCFTAIGKLPRSRFVTRLVGHVPRWLLSFVLFVLALSAMAEGILTNDTYLSQSLPNQPHLYLPGAALAIAGFISLIYYYFLEKWRAKNMIWLLIVYWVVSLVTVIVKLVHLQDQDLNDWQLFVFVVYSGLAVLLTAMLLIELTLCYSLVCRRYGDPLNSPRPDETREDDMRYMHDFSTILSSLTFWWLNWLFAAGYKKPVDPSDLGSIPDIHSSEHTHRCFKSNFMKEKERAAQSGRDISLYRVLWDTYGVRMITGGVFKVCSDCCNYVGPLCISAIVIYATNVLHGSQEEQEGETTLPHYVTVTEFFANGFVLVGCVFIAQILKGVFEQAYQYRCYMEGLHVRSALQSMVYEKSLRLSTYAMSGGMMTMGQITNHMSVDANNIQFFFNYGNELWTIPIKVVIIIYLLYLQLGTPALIGSSLFILVLPAQLMLGAWTSKYIKQVLIDADQRIKQSNEMLQGMKLLKLYGWERVYCEFVKSARKKELSQILILFLIQANNALMTNGIPAFVNLVSFTTFTAITGDVLTPDAAFASLYLFYALSDPMFILPYVISLSVHANASIKRIETFLVAPEIEGGGCLEMKSSKSQPSTVGRNGHSSSSAAENGGNPSARQPLLGSDNDQVETSCTSYGSLESRSRKVDGAEEDSSVNMISDLPAGVAIQIENGSFTWDPNSDVPVLHDVNLDIPEGKLTVIVGTVGSGKSSLMQAVLGEMTTLSGSVKIKQGARIAYAPQKAWLLNTSLRENILFGQPYDQSRYRKVIDACALGPDIDMLPAGDKTEIGEKGLNLSGGQKQRISVARTMYAGRDVVILDDPLSALDMHVGGHLFNQGIMKILRKQNQTVLLVTHQLQYLQDADKIIVMKKGRILRQGDPDELAEADPSLKTDWQQALLLVSESESELDLAGGESEAVREERKLLKKQISQFSYSQQSEHTISQSDDEKGRLIEKEDQEKGSISWVIYMYYIKALGYSIAGLILFFVIAGDGLEIATNFWLATWSEASVGVNSTQKALDDASYYISIYAILNVSGLVSKSTSTVFITIGTYFAAKRLHYQVLDKIVSAPMRFFDTTPLGRILNRLSSDTQLIDHRLVQSIRNLFQTGSLLLSAYIVIIAVNVYFIFVVIPAAVVFTLLLIYYVVTSRELQRCESVTRSPVFAHFMETLGGLSTIRAFKEERMFFQTSLDRILLNNKVFAYLITAQRWVAIRLDFLGAVMVLLCTLFSLLGAFYFGIDASYIGLVMSYSLELSLFMNLTVRAAAEVELQMNAVERVKYYAELETEDYEGTEPPPSWPDRGEIELEDISVRYASHLDAVLTDINLTIPPNDKLGICGRTGSGKSSLTLALFRMIDTFKGRIIIDGIDIRTIPLLTLRQRLSIIPQDSFLFTGTIRSNLDPKNLKDDDELWHSLEIAQLKDVVSELEGGLDFEVTEGGDNFSAGQRQLFCLARAFLRNSKVVIMDEATASIDQETDRILQDVVADVFQDRTVLTIAHRVTTILNADTILTLRDGEVIEFDSPTALLDDEDSVFASLVKAGK